MSLVCRIADFEERLNKRLDKIEKKLDDVIYDDDNNGILYSPEESWQIDVVDQLEHIKDIGELSDGYHTFNSLYHQRAVLFAALVDAYPELSWKSSKHSDGKYCFDSDGKWFIVGIDTPKGQYTYHYEIKYWDMFNCQELERAPEWDGHTDADVERLRSLKLMKNVVYNKSASEKMALENYEFM